MSQESKVEEKPNLNAFVRRKLIGRKLGMTQIFKEDGTCVPVTVVEAGPCTVVQVKTAEKDRYDSVQIGFVPVDKNVTKPLRGHFARAGTTPMRYLREVRLRGKDHGLKPGMQLTVDVFEGITKVDVSGISKGRGFAGTVKRWHFERGPETHGSMNVRRPGSIGSSTNPARVWKGRRMAGHMGARRSTCRNLKIVKIDREKNLMLVGGSVPGPDGGFIEVSSSLGEPREASR